MKKISYLVVWWMNQAPHAALFEDRIAAEAAASVRNALMVTLTGRDAKVESVLDWYRRTDAGEPMPAEWRDILGQIRMPWPPRKGRVPTTTGGTAVATAGGTAVA
jgi:hypothetical protein